MAFSPKREKNPFLRLLRNPVYLTRIFFVLIASLAGYWVGRGYIPNRGLEGTLIGLIVAGVFMLFEIATRVISSKKLLLATAGLLLGLVFSWLIYPTIPATVFGDLDSQAAQDKARILCNLVFGYLGIVIALKNAHRFSFSRMNFIMSAPGEGAKLLDTSVIVDGRIRQLIESGFMTGNFIVPEFVIEELQTIADSADSKRRARGRRGLEVLEQIKDNLPDLHIMEQDFPNLRGVDQKLVQLAREINATLVTNDYNLQKVAQLHQVRVINLNELSNFLKPTVYVGEGVTLLISREGKESGQGIGYLEDGTMVVVEDGQALIGSQADVTVTSILQTPAGRMIFSRLDSAGPDHNETPTTGNPQPNPAPRPWKDNASRSAKDNNGRIKAPRPGSN